MESSGKEKKQQLTVLIFIAIWAVVNLLQAAFTEVHADEAYYWVYSRFPDWGYFDHPPAVALFIRAGDMLLSNTLGLRLMTVIASTWSVWLLWLIVKPYALRPRLFILLFSGMVLFHVYGFITTPDAPLGFFIVIFFYLFQRYQQEDRLTWAFLLALVSAAMLYSKYHAILVIGFTVLSNFRLLARPSFWLVAILASLLFLPHIWWQVKQNYPSYYYHVIDRSAAPYRFSFTLDYLFAQLALAGPLLGWYLYTLAARKNISSTPVPDFVQKHPDLFLRAIKFNYAGVFIFFLISTLKGRVEAHWTLPGMICLFILAYVHLSRRPADQTGRLLWFEWLAAGNILLVIIVRLILVVPVSALHKINVVAYYFNNRKWAEQIKKKAGDLPVIFLNSFQMPSRYNYYTRSTKGFAYNSRYYRRNQYDIWPLEDSLQNKTAYLIREQSTGGGSEDKIITDKGVFYGEKLDHVRMYQKLSVEPVSTVPQVAGKGQKIKLQLKISNPYQLPVRLDNKGSKWKCWLEYGYLKDGVAGDFYEFPASLEGLVIQPGGSAEIQGAVTAPESSGKFKLIFSIRTEPFLGSRNSSMIALEVK